MPTDTATSTSELLSLTSAAFAPNAAIPSKYTCDGENISPPLAWSGAPEGTKSFALIMDDPDIPQAVKEKYGIKEFVHWVLFNISPEARGISEGGTAGTAGATSAGTNAYVGPCPPPQYEPREHRYIFTLYALNGKLNFGEPPSKRQVLDALRPIFLAKAELIGRYSRK